VTIPTTRNGWSRNDSLAAISISGDIRPICSLRKPFVNNHAPNRRLMQCPVRQRRRSLTRQPRSSGHLRCQRYWARAEPLYIPPVAQLELRLRQRESLTLEVACVSSRNWAGGQMDLREQIRTGATCQRCGTGTVTLDTHRPDHARPGFTEMSFRCSACPDVTRQTQDNRFI
jgi:hypothetical protein